MRIICFLDSGLNFTRLKVNFLAEHIHFDFGSYQLSPEARFELQNKAGFLSQYPSVTVEIQGHCDQRGPRKFNRALAYLRASEVYDYLVSLGLDASRLSAVSYGTRRLLDPTSSEEALARNRRAQFVITAE